MNIKTTSKMLSLPFLLLSLFVLLLPVDCFREDFDALRPSMVKRGERKTLMVSEFGEISAVDITSGTKGSFHLEFMTLEPNSLFLPVLLHADMVFYVNTGSGKLSWSEDGKEMRRMEIKKGDVYRLHAGSVFFVQSNLETERQKLRIYSIYSNTDEDIYVPSLGAYSSISDLVLGFDRKLLKSAFNAPDEVIEDMESASRPEAIVHALSGEDKKKSILKELEARIVRAVIGNTDYDFSNGKKKTKTFNMLQADHDFENCNGWSVTVDRKDLKSLRHSQIGIFMVNLTKGSMMGPHWNPMATEIAIVLQGEGMIRVVCSSNVNETECKNMRFRVTEGDVFTIPRFHPMAQMSFNNNTFVFMGFSTSTRRNYPQFLAGKSSVLQTLSRDILAASFNVTNTTVDALLTPQEEAIILDCTSCAEEEEVKMVREWEEEEAREREEERKREEEKKRKEEEERKREEEARKQEEERKREEEERKREEEEKKRKEEEERKREEEDRKREEEERKRKEEEERKREEEEAAKKREEEEEAERERREKEIEEAEKRGEEERKRREERARREQEEARREQEERRRQKKEKEEAAKEKEREKEEGEKKEREREEAETRRKEEQKRQEKRARKEQEAAKREQEERRRKQREREEAAKKREREKEGGEGEGQPDEDRVGNKNEEILRRIAARRLWKAQV